MVAFINELQVQLAKMSDLVSVVLTSVSTDCARCTSLPSHSGFKIKCVVLIPLTRNIQMISESILYGCRDGTGCCVPRTLLYRDKILKGAEFEAMATGDCPMNLQINMMPATLYTVKVVV